MVVVTEVVVVLLVVVVLGVAVVVTAFFVGDAVLETVPDSVAFSTAATEVNDVRAGIDNGILLKGGTVMSGLVIVGSNILLSSTGFSSRNK